MPAAWDSLTGADSPRWWARKALTGEGESDDARLVNEELDPLLEDADADLQSRYPCVGSTPWNSLTGTQLSSWAKAVGFLAAMGEFQGPQGASWASGISEVKIGPVTEKSGIIARSAADIASDLEGMIGGALVRIECIKAWRAAKNKGRLFGVAGRRQSIGSDSTVQGQMLGLNRNRQLPK